MNCPRLIIAGTHSGVGKTTVSLALMAALAAKGRRVQPFKVGPDFLDPTHHRVATGFYSYNLDGWMVDDERNQEMFRHAACEADISIVEGMMGLFDGASPVDDFGSTAHMAKLLKAPVVLVVDGSAMARSVAALVHGYVSFDSSLWVAGVVLNNIRSEGHFLLLKKALEAYTSVKVLGFLKPDAALRIEDRHLGLKVAFEDQSPDVYVRLGQAISETVNLEEVEALAGMAETLPVNPACSSPGSTRRVGSRTPAIRIGVAYDSAFCFYYQENFRALEEQGAQLVFFSPLSDAVLPPVDLLYLGGGYPELHSEELSKNYAMRQAIKEFAVGGGVVYAECGGLMYVMESIEDFDGARFSMAGLFPFVAKMDRDSMRIGYRNVEIITPCILGHQGITARGHEFHYSKLVPVDSAAEATYACTISDVGRTRSGPDGLMYKNSLALYTHLYFRSQPLLVEALIASAAAAC